MLEDGCQRGKILLYDMAMTNGPRSVLLMWVLAFASLILTLGAVEVLLRTGIVPQRVYRSTAIEEEHVSAMELPDFRLPDADLREKGSAFRILVIGDSFAWGDGVYAEDAFPHRLQTRLNSISKGDRFEVVNWSRPGWNTRRQVRSLRKGKQMARVQPDLMIVSFVLNDSEPISLESRQKLLTETAGHEATSGLSAWLFDHSRLYEIVWTRLENNRTHRAMKAFYRSLFQGEHWEACLRAFGDLKTMSQNHGAPLILVIFPVFDGPMDDSYHYLDLHAKVRQAAQQLEIPVLDLLSVYRRVDGYRLAVTPFSDAHPNELAHRLAADEILDFLVRGKFVPQTDHQPARRKRIRQ